MTESGPAVVERRAHPRVAHRAQAEVVAAGEITPIPCETVDISLGGVKITSILPVPVGPCTIRLEDVEIPGTVLGQIIDVETGLMISRIQFATISDHAHDELVAITTASAEPAAAVPAAVAVVGTRRRWIGLAAAAAVVIAVVVVALIARGGSSSDDTDAASLASESSTESPSASESASEEPEASASEDVEPAATPSATVPSEPTDSVSPSASPAPAPAPAPASSDPAPAPAPAPALVTRTETADNGVRVELSEDPSQTVVASTVGPSDGVDRVRIQLDVIPSQEGTTLPVAITVENRGDGPLEFPQGLKTTITVTAEDGTTRDVVLQNADITSIAAGQRVELGGSIDFGSYGSFSLSATTPVAERG